MASHWEVVCLLVVGEEQGSHLGNVELCPGQCAECVTDTVVVSPPATWKEVT